MDYKKITVGALSFFMSSFVVQGILGFAVAGEYYFSIPIMREAPLIYLGMPATVIMGIGFSILYPATRFSGTNLMKGLKFGLLVGSIMVPFVALDIPGRFEIPSVELWTLSQGILGIVHYAAAGILVGLVYKSASKGESGAAEEEKATRD